MRLRAVGAKELKILPWLVKIGVTLVVLLIAFSFTIGGNMKFYSKWNQCGQKPVAAMPGSSHFGKVSYYKEEPVFTLTRPSAFFCSPLQAEQHGYSANSQGYSFPNIKSKYGQVCRLETDPVSETSYEFALCDE